MSNRLQRALKIRDHALRIVSGSGEAETIGGKRYAVLDVSPWRIAFGSPFGAIATRLHPPKGVGAYQGAILLQKSGGRTNLDYSLSIWRGPKVLLVEWDAAEPKELHVSSFKRGDWETEFLAWAPF
jgi:hypothetical protein